MCDRCLTTPIDPLDKDYVDAEIVTIAFLDEGKLGLGLQMGDLATSVPCPTSTPPPRLGEHARLYGEHGAIDRLEGSLRGLVIGVGQGETPRRVFYRTQEHQRALVDHVSAAAFRLAVLDMMLANPDLDAFLAQDAENDGSLTKAQLVEERDRLRQILTPVISVGGREGFHVPSPFADA